MLPGQITVLSQKYGGIPHYTFPLRLLSCTPSLWIAAGEYGRLLVHHSRGITFPVQNRSLEFFWPDRPYNVAYGYPAEVAAGAEAALQELIRLVESRSFPFDGSVERLAGSTDGM
jgi:hypothetical protein